MGEVGVIVSGGFWLAYHAVLADLEGATGLTVRTLSGASQGSGPKTIRWQVENGTAVDVVVLSREGLGELSAIGRVAAGSVVDLASVPLAAAVRRGAPWPDIGTAEAFREALLRARLVVMPGSTSGLFVRDVIFPRLAITDRISARVMTRGTDSTAALAAGEADLAIGPVSELVDQPGIEIVGALPEAVQLHQVFAAARLDTARRPDQADRVIAFLASARVRAAIEAAGMNPPAARPAP